MTEPHQSTNDIIVYHGTFWTMPEDGSDPHGSVFFDLDPNYSDLGVTFVTNAIETAVYFSSWHKNNQEDIQVVLRGSLTAEKLFEKSSAELTKNRWFEIEDVEYDVSDREECFQALRGKYDGFSIRGNYDGVGDDIALFKGDHFKANEAMLLIDGEWTDWMDLEDAREAFCLACGNGRTLRV